jgi:hypothetical protein
MKCGRLRGVVLDSGISSAVRRGAHDEIEDFNPDSLADVFDGRGDAAVRDCARV